ncbi:MAG: hypothetical protein K2P92_06335 [Bdellovibrionaceae bacterium]|nr:hypothetical protein [Pseudobdellovibrionaceae bacterium]
MMNSNGLFIFLMCFMSLFWTARPQAQESGPLVAAAESDFQDIFFLCKNTKSTRWLRAYRQNGKCVTTYSKEGYLQVISSATYFASCEAVLHNVRKNIEEGGFKCSRLETYSYIDIE